MISQDMHKLARHILYAKARPFCLSPKSQELPQNFPINHSYNGKTPGSERLPPFLTPCLFGIHIKQRLYLYMSIKNW